MTCPLTCFSRSERFANQSPSMCNNDCRSGQIFFFLEPLDLLYLSRTTKVLRAFLLSRSKSSTLWKNAISNVKGFPPCPDHMSAPAYTHLAFVPVCHVSVPTTVCAESILTSDYRGASAPAKLSNGSCGCDAVQPALGRCWYKCWSSICGLIACLQDNTRIPHFSPHDSLRLGSPSSLRLLQVG